MNSACCELGVDSAYALGAADWARAFYPDLQVEIEPEQIVVRSDRRNEAELSLIWKVALANEKLQRQAQSHRNAVLGELLA